MYFALNYLFISMVATSKDAKDADPKLQSKSKILQEIPFSVNFVISCFSTLISRTLTYPFDTIKTNLQNNSKAIGLYQGLMPTLILSSPAMGIYLASYDFSKEYLTRFDLDQGSFANATISGCFAEALSGALFVPMEVIKEKLQVSNHKPIPLIKSVYNQYGLYGFYRGFFLTMAVYLPYSTTYFVSYEKLKTISKNDSFTSHLGCAFIAASLAAIVSNPMDVVHTRVQIRTVDSTSNVIKEIITQDGWKGFTKGMLPRITWAAPSMAISIAIWETLKQKYSEFYS